MDPPFPPPPPLPMFETESQNFASAPSVPRGFKLKKFWPAFGGHHTGTLGGGGFPAKTPSPPSPPSNTSLGNPLYSRPFSVLTHATLAFSLPTRIQPSSSAALSSLHNLRHLLQPPPPRRLQPSPTLQNAATVAVCSVAEPSPVPQHRIQPSGTLYDLLQSSMSCCNPLCMTPDNLRLRDFLTHYSPRQPSTTTSPPTLVRHSTTLYNPRQPHLLPPLSDILQPSTTLDNHISSHLCPTFYNPLQPSTTTSPPTFVRNSTTLYNPRQPHLFPPLSDILQPSTTLDNHISSHLCPTFYNPLQPSTTTSLPTLARLCNRYPFQRGPILSNPWPSFLTFYARQHPPNRH